MQLTSLLCTQKDTQNGSRSASVSRTRKLFKGEWKASLVLGGLRTGSWVEEGRNGRHQLRRCSDDLWIEDQKKYKCKLARAIRGSLGQLNILTSEDLEKVRCGQSAMRRQNQDPNLGKLCNLHLLSPLCFF